MEGVEGCDGEIGFVFAGAGDDGRVEGPAEAVAVEGDADKSVGIKGSGETGLLAIPDRKFTTETLANVSKGVTAVAQLWMRNVVPTVNSAAAAPAQLRTVTVRDGDQEAKVEVYFLGITKTEAGTVELGLYARDKEPLVKVTLVKTDAPASATPIALDGRKENKPKGSAAEMADAMGIELLSEIEYRHLQTLGKYDLKTSSWIATPAEMRKLGGALFCDRRYERVFAYHN